MRAGINAGQAGVPGLREFHQKVDADQSAEEQCQPEVCTPADKRLNYTPIKGAAPGTSAKIIAFIVLAHRSAVSLKRVSRGRTNYNDGAGSAQGLNGGDHSRADRLVESAQQSVPMRKNTNSPNKAKRLP